MLHQFFSKSKPIHFVVVYCLMLCWIVFVSLIRSASLKPVFLEVLWSGLLVLFILALFNFIVHRNRLTQNNSLALYYFSMFLMLFLGVSFDTDALLSFVFFLLGLRRILSIRTTIDIRQKVFDAAFWLSISAFFQPQILFFLLLIFISLALFEGKPNRIWFIPFAGVFVPIFLVFTWFYITDQQPFFIDLFAFDSIRFLDFSQYSDTPITLYFIFFTGLLTVFFFYKKLVRKSAIYRKVRLLIFFGWLVSLLLIAFFMSQADKLLLLLFPFVAVFSASFTESLGKPILKELWMWLFTAFTAVLMFHSI
ncbi:MAG: DUF6427 family protein [Flavobacteriaceae bacterium]|nr:DUF6427 family protein [Flavobacteriaceae bacterium]